MIRNQRGSGLLLVIIVFAMLFVVLGMSLERSGQLFIRVHKKHLETVAFNLAEAGVEYTIHRMVVSNEDYSGGENISLDTGTFSTSVTRLSPSDKIEILSTGKAKGSGRLSDVVKTLRVVVRLSREDLENPLAILSREEIS